MHSIAIQPAVKYGQSGESSLNNNTTGIDNTATGYSASTQTQLGVIIQHRVFKQCTQDSTGTNLAFANNQSLF